MSNKNTQRDDHMEEDNRPPPQFPDNWVYAQELDLVIHMPGSCKQCDDFLSHSMLASVQRLQSYCEALMERADSLNTKLRYANQRIEEFKEEENEMRRQLRVARREADDLREELVRERSWASLTMAVAPPPRPGPYDERRHTNDTRCKVQQVREERSARSYSSVVQSTVPPPSNVAVVPPPSLMPADSSAQQENVASSSNILHQPSFLKKDRVMFEG